MTRLSERTIAGKIISVHWFVAFTLVSYVANGQVNLQTGSATFSLPMFNWQDHKSNLHTVVALSYNSGNGLKTSEVASNVGTGWSLVAGGVVTRMQVGEPDDQVAHGSATETDLTKYPDGYIYASKKAIDGCPEALTKYPIYKHKNQLYKQHNSVAEDRELDYFSFQFNGKSGLFVLKKMQNGAGSTTGPDEGVMLGDSKIKITFQRDISLPLQGIRATITAFFIQDVDGLIYKFSKHSYSKLLKTQYCDKYVTHKKDQPNFKEDHTYFQADFLSHEIPNDRLLDGWYLTEIKDPLTLRRVTLTYDSLNINSYAGTQLSHTKTPGKEYAVVSHRRSITLTPVLTSIVYPDGHVVSFLNNHARQDLAGGKGTSQVDITYNGRHISRYILQLTYFIGNRYGKPVSEYQKRVARLCLKSVQKIGVDLKEDSPPYAFDYYTGSNALDDVVPEPFSYFKDIWGYYNGSNSRDFKNGDVETIPAKLTNNDIKGLCYLREGAGNSSVAVNPKNGYAKNGLLKQIIYPTGGALTYTYAQNWGLLFGQYQAVGGVHVDSTKSTDGGGSSNGCGNPVVTLYNYVTDGGQSSLWGLEDPVRSVAMTSVYEPKEKKYKNPLFGGGLFGSCYYKYRYPGILSVEQATNLSSFMQFMEAAGPALGVMGTVSTVMSAVKWMGNVAKPLVVVSVIIDVIVGLYTAITTCFVSPDKTVASTLFYNYDLNSVSPLPTQFKRVEVVENPGTIGKTVHEFTSDEQYPVWHLANPGFSTRQRFAAWDYGLPLKTTVYNAAGSKVKETINEYDTSHRKRPAVLQGKEVWNQFESNLVSCKCNVTTTRSQKNTDWANPTLYTASYATSHGDMDVVQYTYYTGRRNLVRTTEKTYNESTPSAFVSGVTEYSYDPDNYEIASVGTYASNGDLTKKTITYAYQWYSVMAQHNILTLPVYTETHFTPASTGISKLLSVSRTQFVQLQTGAFKPSVLYEKSFALPADYALASNTPERAVKTFTYDTQGNLTGVKDEGGRVVSNLYDYDDKYVTATVINGDPVTDKCFYTSFETSSAGGWSATGGSPAYINGPAPTGNRGLNLNGSTVSASGLTGGQEYRLSFWSTSALSVSGVSSPVVSGPTLNGLTYYEYTIPANQTTVSLSGNAVIDELRLYPKKARMSTVTYDPLIGKTSECDQNNRITYYEYDNLGRMRFIKDEKRNIVKMFEYNNVSRRPGCPTTFLSRHTKEYFRKSNCGTGYVGGEVAYEIPAGKYTSTVSQEDADAKVESELLELGQAYANASPTCLWVYYNIARSGNFVRENCDEGYIGSTVTYTVPAGRYSSTVSQGEADTLAMEDIEANGDAYANGPDNAGSCTYNDQPIWEYVDGAPTQCMMANGQNTIHVLCTNANPNSVATHGPTSWQNTGDPGSCPAPSCSYATCDATSQRLKCINGICREGAKVVTADYYDFSMGEWACVFHYEWPDGSWSANYIQYYPNPGNCYSEQ